MIEMKLDEERILVNVPYLVQFWDGGRFRQERVNDRQVNISMSNGFLEKIELYFCSGEMFDGGVHWFRVKDIYWETRAYKYIYMKEENFSNVLNNVSTYFTGNIGGEGFYRSCKDDNFYSYVGSSGKYDYYQKITVRKALSMLHDNSGRLDLINYKDVWKYYMNTNKPRFDEYNGLIEFLFKYLIKNTEEPEVDTPKIDRFEFPDKIKAELIETKIKALIKDYNL